MSDFKKKYKGILKGLEENMQNNEDLELAKKSLELLTNEFIEMLNRIEQNNDKKFNALYENQKKIEQKLSSIEGSVNNIEEDIYDVDENYDLEVVCPYCNFEFMIDEDEQNNEIECPKCGNIIEIDWEGNSFEEDCGGHCSSCSGHCGLEDNELENEENEDEDI